MENKEIFVRDPSDLLDLAVLLAPDEYGDSRYRRAVTITAGARYSEYGGPEEGGWHYDRFFGDYHVPVLVYSTGELEQAISAVKALMALTHREVEYPEIHLGTQPEMYVQERMRYE
jgi:hypothetical protein